MTTVPYKPWLDVRRVMKESHRIAAYLLTRFKGHSVEPGDVVNSALEDLYRACKGDWTSKDYFYRAMEQAMRDYLAARYRKKPAPGVLVRADSSFDHEDFKALSDATSAALRRALTKLADSEKLEHRDWARVLAEYYYVGEDEPAIARKLGAVPSVGEGEAKKG